MVVAVRDHEHFRLKLLYTQKKKVEQENKQLRQDKDKYSVSFTMSRELITFFKTTCMFYRWWKQHHVVFAKSSAYCRVKCKQQVINLCCATYLAVPMVMSEIHGHCCIIVGPPWQCLLITPQSYHHRRSMFLSLC